MLKMEHIDEGRAFDWGKTSPDYAKYRDVYPEEFYRQIVELGHCTAGQDVLDLGTGTGVLPRNLYAHGARWTGVDLAENQIAEAVRLAAEGNMDIRFFTAQAEHTGLPDHSFDVITACQCFFYFDAARMAQEISRMLREEGHFLELFMAWLPFENEIAAKSEELVLQYNPSWNACGMQRTVYPSAPEWSLELFDYEHILCYDISVPFTRESWNGRIRACRGIGASLSPAEVEAFDREHMELLHNIAPEQFDILHFASLLDFKRKKA